MPKSDEDTGVDTGLLDLTDSGEVCIASLTNPETENNHIGWSEHKNDHLKMGDGGSHIQSQYLPDKGAFFP